METKEKTLLKKIEELEKIITQQEEKISDLEEKIEEYEEEEMDAEEKRYIDCWNKDMDRFHRDAYGELTPEEGGIRDYSYDKIEYNDAGEPIGYC